MSVQEENLDDVIASLIDDVDEEEGAVAPNPITEDDYQKEKEINDIYNQLNECERRLRILNNE